MRASFPAIAAAVTLLSWTPSSNGAVAVAIDRATTYQTIDGVGICSVLPVWQAGNYYLPDQPFWPSFADTLIRVMGISIVRGFDTRACEFNPSAGTYVVTASIRSELLRYKTMKQVADAQHETFRIAPNVFSPPGWMKGNGQCNGLTANNSLLPAHYDDFGKLCAAFITMARDSFGLPIYAFSPQNEPAFDESYASCVYAGGAQYAQMLRVVGPRIKAASPATLIFGVEGVDPVFPSWEGLVTSDTVAVRYIDRFACHWWGTNIRAQAVTYTDPFGTRARPVWATEANWDNSWDNAGAADFAFQLLRLFTVGHVSALMVGGDYWNTTNGSKAFAFWMTGQLARFIRPDMKNLGATSGDTAVRVGAFGSGPTGPLSVVLVNHGATAKDVTLSATGAALPAQFTEVRRTGGGDTYRNLGPMASTATFSVPGYGMLSMGYGHVGAQTGTITRQPGTAPRTVRDFATSRVGRAFDLCGRLTQVTSAASTSATNVRVVEDISGRRSLRLSAYCGSH
jgi:O-glycosyl hydrolase